MTSIRLNLTHRPIKLGFMVRPGNRQDAELAIQLSSGMWGGAYNPLIPEVKRISRIWKEPHINPGTGEDIINGYIRYFDPDFLVTKSQATYDSKLDVIRGRISYDEIYHTYHSEKTLNYGVSIFELAEYLLKNELKYVRKVPIKFVFPVFPKKDSLFFTALFGKLPKDIEDGFVNYFGKALEIEQKACNLYNFTEFLDPSNLYVRRILDVGIRKHNVRGKLLTFFLLNSRDGQDVADFWNLRASGKNIVPLPIESFEKDAIFEYVLDTLKHYNILGHTGLEYYRIPNFMKSRSLKKSEFERFERLLAEIFSKRNITRPQIQIQNWYPRLWDTNNIEYNFGECSDFEHSKKTQSLDSIPEKLSFSTSQLSVMDN